MVDLEEDLESAALAVARAEEERQSAEEQAELLRGRAEAVRLGG